jgi:hypothetical protein
VFVAALLSGCPGFGDDEIQGVFSSPPTNLTVTYEQHISKIDGYYCTYCHTPGSGRAPATFPLNTFVDSSTFAGLSIGRISGSTMPPSSENNPVSDIDMAYYERWVDCGKPQTPAEATCPTGDAPANNGDDDDGLVTFGDDIEPIFATNCNFLGCHGGQPAPMAAGGLNLETFDAAVLSIVPCDPDSSPIVDRINREVADPFVMPQGTNLDPEKIALIEKWIREGDDIKGMCQ